MRAPRTVAILLAELEGFEHLLFEPMTQVDLDRLYALSERRVAELGDGPEAIALSDALDDFIAAGIEDGDVERAYLELVETVRGVSGDSGQGAVAPKEVLTICSPVRGYHRSTRWRSTYSLAASAAARL